MDLKTYFQLFWAPAIASAALITFLSTQGVLSGRAGLFVIGWFVVAVAAQYFGAMAGGLWVSGLALQTSLAVFLLLKHHAGHF